MKPIGLGTTAEITYMIPAVPHLSLRQVQAGYRLVQAEVVGTTNQRVASRATKLTRVQSYVITIVRELLLIPWFPLRMRGLCVSGLHAETGGCVCVCEALLVVGTAVELHVKHTEHRIKRG
jgi:hypothetical protein